MLTGLVHTPTNPSKVAFVLSYPTIDELHHGEALISGISGYIKSLVSRSENNILNHYVIYAFNKGVKGNDETTIPFAELLSEKKAFFANVEELKSLGVTTLIPMGEIAFSFCSGVSEVLKYRGSILPVNKFDGMKMVGTLDARQLYIDQGKIEPIIVNDIARGIEESLTEGISLPERNITIFRNILDAVEFFKKITGQKKPVSVDIETNGKTLLTAYGVATSPSTAYVVPMDLLKSPKVLRAIATFARSTTPKIMHNVGFDVLYTIYYYRMYHKNVFFDTLIAHHSCYPTLPKSLAFCASMYTREPYWKDDGKNAFASMKKASEEAWEQYYNYNGRDCCVTYELYEKLDVELDECGVRHIFNTAMETLDPALFTMLDGMLVDQKRVAYLRKRQDAALAILNGLCDKILPGVNLNSSPQLRALIYDEWRFPVQTKDGKVVLDSKKLATFEAMSTPYKLRLGLIQKTRTYRKAGSFYNYPVNSDGKFRFEAKVAGTDTTRWATSKSITGSGQNIQNFPKLARCVFVPGDGYIFVQGDLSQVEARIVAALTGDTDWVHAFDLMDLHSDVASFLFGIPIEQVNKDTHRQTAKRVAHASHYKLGKKLLSEILKISMGEASRLLDAYYVKRPLLSSWHANVEQQIRKNHFVETCFGLKIHYFGPVDDDLIRAAIAAVPQSTGAQYLNNALSQFYKIPYYRFVNQVHDSALARIPNNLDKIKEVMRRMKEITEVPITVNGITLTVPMDFDIGFDWYNMSGVKNVYDDAVVEAAYEAAVKKQEAFNSKIILSAV